MSSTVATAVAPQPLLTGNDGETTIEDVVSLPSLPYEVLSVVFGFLDTRSLARLACVCRSLRALAEEGSEWRRRSKARWLLVPKKKLVKSWKTYYCERDNETRKNWKSGTCDMFTLWGHTDHVTCVSMSGAYAVTGSADMSVRVWEVKSTKVGVATLTGHSGQVTGVSMNEDSATVLSTSTDTCVKLWDLDRGSEKGTLRLLCGLNDVQVHGTTALVACDDGAVRAVDLRGPSSSSSSPSSSSSSSGATHKLFASVSARTSGSASTGRSSETGLQGDPILSISWLGSHTFVAGSTDRTLALWDIRSEKGPVQVMAKHKKAVTSVLLTKDGQSCFSGALDGSCYMWRLSDGHVIKKYIEHKGGITGMATDDGSGLVTSSADRSVRFWHVRSMRCTHTLSNYSGSADCLWLTSDFLLVGSVKTLNIFDFSNSKDVAYPVPSPLVTPSGGTGGGGAV